MGDTEREAAILARCEAATPTCGKCRLPIHRGDTVRHFGFYVAHLETRCIELLHGQLAEITASYEAATAQLTTLRARAERAEGALVEAVYAFERAAAPLLPQASATLPDGRVVTACDGHAPEYEFFLKLDAAFRLAIRAFFPAPATDTQGDRCSGCGQLFSEPACGPGHAMIAHERALAARGE